AAAGLRDVAHGDGGEAALGEQRRGLVADLAAAVLVVGGARPGHELAPTARRPAVSRRASWSVSLLGGQRRSPMIWISDMKMLMKSRYSRKAPKIDFLLAVSMSSDSRYSSLIAWVS